MAIEEQNSSMIRILINSILLLCLLVHVSACGLIMDEWDSSGCYSHVRIEVDWSAYGDETPEGMSLYFYHDGQTFPTIISSNETSHVDVTLQDGTYRVMVINYSQEEFENLQFEGMDSPETAKLTTKGVNDSWFQDDFPGEVVSEQPETFGYYIDSCLQVNVATIDSGSYQLSALLKPTLATEEVEIIVHARGLNYLSSLRGALTGMAAGYYLMQTRSTEETTTFLTDDWTVTRDAGDSNLGTLTATMNTFGLPYGHTGVDTANYVILSATRSDAQVTLHKYAVGNRFERVGTNLWRIEVGDSLIITKPDTWTSAGNNDSSTSDAEHSSGFNATINDWNSIEDFNFEL